VPSASTHRSLRGRNVLEGAEKNTCANTIGNLKVALLVISISQMMINDLDLLVMYCQSIQRIAGSKLCSKLQINIWKGKVPCVG
jgi:hypothetical protein